MGDVIQFDYKIWDNKKDYLLDRPGNNIAYAVLLNSVDVGDMLTIKKRKEDTLIKEAEEGVVELLAAAIEFLRWRGYSAEEVQSKVKAFKQANHDRRDQQALRDTLVLQAIHEYSNPNDLKVVDTVVVG